MNWPLDQKLADARAAKWCADVAARALAEEKRAARLRLTCAALTGHIMDDSCAAPEKRAGWAVADADACLALLYPPLNCADCNCRGNTRDTPCPCDCHAPNFHPPEVPDAR